MKKISVFTIIFILLLLVGCSSSPIKIQELQESLNENGEIVRIYTKSKITENGNTIILNGVSQNNEFTGTKENVLYSMPWDAMPTYGMEYNVSIFETFEKNELKQIEYILKYDIRYRKPFGGYEDFEQIISFAKFKFIGDNISLEMGNIESLISPQNKIYETLPSYTRPAYFFMFKNQKPEMSKKIIATFNTKVNGFTSFDYYLNMKKANTSNFNEEQKFKYIEELSIRQMNDFPKFLNERLTIAQAKMQTFSIVLGAVQDSLNQYQQNKESNNELKKNNSDLQYKIAGKELNHRLFLIKHGSFIEPTQREARKNAWDDYNNSMKPRY